MSIFLLKKVKKNSGFTIAEIMVTIGIIIVLSGISWTAFKNYQPSLVLSTSARDLVSDLRLAQQLSITEQVNHGIYFDSVSGTYRLEKYSPTTQILFSKNLPSGITIYQITGLSEQKAIFNPYGSSVSSGTITIKNAPGSLKVIEIKPSGFVKIQS